MKTRIRENLYTYIACAIVIGACIVVAGISLLSEFGMHPDEWDVRACLDWCKTRFIWPDMRLYGEGLGDTYSGYGYTKVCNYTPYFLIASKIAAVFESFMRDLPYYRMPNLLLMAGMTVYMVRAIPRKRWVFIGFGICVQAWYIFSYVTADAQDYVLAFIAIMLLGDEESLLWKTISSSIRNASSEQPDCLNRPAIILRCILLGLLYGLILLGKPYFYATLALTFAVLVHHLIKSELNIRKQLLLRCILIAGVAFAILLARFGLDLYYYGTDKAQVKTEMAEIYSDPDKKPSASADVADPTYHMYSKGASIGNLFEEDPLWFAKSFRSFAAARVSESGDGAYFVMMAFLYAAIYIWIGITLCRGGDIFIFAIGTLLNAGGVVASVLNSYLIDSQPQGRYLLPIVLCTCYLGSRARSLWENRAFRAIVLAAGALSLIYFGLFDSRVFIDLGYVRSLF